MRTAITALLAGPTVLLLSSPAYADIAPDPVETTGIAAIIIAGAAAVAVGAIFAIRYARRRGAGK